MQILNEIQIMLVTHHHTQLVSRDTCKLLDQYVPPRSKQMPKHRLNDQ